MANTSQSAINRVTTPNASQSSPAVNRYNVFPKLLDILRSAGAIGDQFTVNEVLSYLGLYISKKPFFDARKPTQILCANDPLEQALGVKAFTMGDIPILLKPRLRLVPALEGNGLQQFRQPEPQPFVEKRKTFDADDINPKRHCSPFLWPGCSPMFIEIPQSPVYDSSAETIYSIQGYETELCKDSSDDLWFLESDEEFNGASEVEFDVEYELLSETSSQHNEDFSDTESEVADVVGAAILLCHTDSDVEFWADYSDTDNEGHDSSESDPEMTDGDKWKCRHCSALNRPLLRFCQKCWQLRNDWLPNRRRPRRNPRRLRRTISAPNGPAAPVDMACMRKRKTSQSLPNFTLAEDMMPSETLPADAQRKENGTKETIFIDVSPVPFPTTSKAKITARPSSSGQSIAAVTICSSPLETVTESLEVVNSPTKVVPLICVPGPSLLPLAAELTGNGGENDIRTDHTSSPEPSTSQFSDLCAVESEELGTCQPEAGGTMCTICLVRPKNASFVHGKTGHQVCCYGCGVKLWERNKPCPVCRRTIQKVIQNFIV